jgi:hypothetical protein
VTGGGHQHRVSGIRTRELEFQNVVEQQQRRVSLLGGCFNRSVCNKSGQEKKQKISFETNFFCLARFTLTFVREKNPRSLIGWFVGLLVCWFVGLLVCWFVGLLVCVLFH